MYIRNGNRTARVQIFYIYFNIHVYPYTMKIGQLSFMYTMAKVTARLFFRLLSHITFIDFPHYQLILK